MEDDKQKKGENEKSLGQNVEQVKKTVDKTKKAAKMIAKIINFLKNNPFLAKILLIVFLAIIIIIIFTAILYVLMSDMYSASNPASIIMDDIMGSTLETGDENSQTGEENNYKTPGALIEGNQYVLKYGDYTQEEKKKQVEEVKRILAKNNIEIYSNQCLLFLYQLKEKGLQLNKYSKGQLEAMYMFFKAEIATSSIDLRSVEEMYELGVYKYPENSIVPQYRGEGENSENNIKMGYSKDLYDENNYDDDTVYGTVRIQRVTYSGDTTGNKVTYLTYVSYDEFIKMIESDKRDKQKEALNHFTIDSEENLIVAGWNNSEIKYTFSGLDEYTADEQAEIKSEYQDGSDYSIYEYRKIPYQEYICKYTMDFDFLMALLATTDDYEFCMELAKLAEESTIVLTLHEEYSVLKKNTTILHEDNDVLYAKLKIRCNAIQTIVEGDKTEQIPKGRLIDNVFVTKDKVFTPREFPISETKNLPEISGEDGLSKEHIDALNTYTKKIVKNYKCIEENIIETNTYSIEVTEIDNWYEHYSKVYSEKKLTPLDEPTQEYQSEAEVYKKTIQIKEPEKIVNVDYIKGRQPEADENFVKYALSSSDLTDTEIEYIQVDEYIYGYGVDNVHRETTGEKWQKGDTAKETVEIKVQENNKTALLNVAVDGAVSGNQTDEKTEYIYGTTYGYKKGFLDIYDKYESVQKTMDSIEEWTFEMLDSSSSAINTSELLKYLLFLYDGKDYGTTEYNLSLLSPGGFTEVNGIYGDTLADKIWYSLRKEGYSKAAVAGVLGNLHYESGGLKPEAVEKGTGIGIGLAQWSYDRRTALETYAMNKGVHWSDENTQIEFLLDEITGKDVYTSGLATENFLSVKYDGVTYNKTDWQTAEEEYPEKDSEGNPSLAIEVATKAFCISWERPLEPSDSLNERIRLAKNYYNYYKDKEYGGTFIKEGLPENVKAKFISETGRTFIVYQQSTKNNYLPGQCNRAATLSIASGYAPVGTSHEEVKEYLDENYDKFTPRYLGVIPSNKYWNQYGLEVTNPYAGNNTKEYQTALQAQLESGGYALIHLNDGGAPYYGVSKTQWSVVQHWIAVLGIKYENGYTLIATSTSGRGINGWVDINEFSNLGVTYMVFVNPIK